MKLKYLAACWVALTFGAAAQASVINFADAQYEATAIALTADGAPGFQSQSGALGPDAVSVAADSAGTNGLATAGAIVGSGLLSTSADVSAGDIASAVATARLITSFFNDGPVNLFIDFSSLDFGTGSGRSTTSLFVLLMSDGVTLFSDYVTSAWTFSYNPVAGGSSVLDLTLTTDVLAAFPDATAGGASGFGLVSVSGTVPEPGSLLLCGLALAGLVLTRRRVTRRSGVIAAAA